MKFENFTSRSQRYDKDENDDRNDYDGEEQPQLTSANLRRHRYSGNGVGGGLFGCGFSDKDSVCSANSIRGKRIRPRIVPMKSSKTVLKKTKVMDYTNYAYNEAVGRLKMMLADSYGTPSKSTYVSSNAYLRNYSEDSTDNFSDNLSVIERPVYSDISKYLSPSQKTRFGPSYRKKPLSGFSASKENLSTYQPISTAMNPEIVPPLDFVVAPKSQMPVDSVQAPAEIFNFIEKQEDYIEQLEKESKYCRNELSNLLGRVKDVINENEQLTETARSELAALTGAGVDKSKPNFSLSSDDSEATVYTTIKKPSTPRKKDTSIKSPRFGNAPNIVYEARISELEAELTQANIDLKNLRTENDELKQKLARVDPVTALTGAQPSNQLMSVVNCDIHRKQIEALQMDKSALEDTVRHLQKSLDDAKSEQYNASSKRYVNDLIKMERSQAELEVKHLREELDRQHERVRELQHEMARRIAEERANAERRYNNQVDQLGGDLSNQWEQVAKLQLDSERQKRYEADLKRDLANRNAQIEELKMELRSNRSTFLADMAQANAEKQSLEQEITAVRLQLDRAAREAKTDAARYNAELNSLRQRLDRGDADLMHSKREVLRLNDEIANLEKELAYGEMKNEIRPTKKDLDKRISEMQEKHAETVNELEEMIQSQKKLMDKLTTECKMLTNKLEDTTLKHNEDKQRLREMNTQLLDRLKQIWASYKDLSTSKRQVQKRRHSFNSVDSSTGDSNAESNRNEHFSERAPILLKPLSTTSRPCLIPPTPQSMVQHQLSAQAQQLSMMITPSPLPVTTTIPYSVQAQQVPTTYSEQQELLRRLQQRHHILPLMDQQQQQQQARNMTQAPMPSVTTKLVTANTDSTIMTTKISRTTLVQVKSSSSSSSSSNSNNNYNQTTAAQKSQMNPTTTKPAAMNSSKLPTKLPHSIQQPIMAPPTLTIAATKATTHHSTMRVPMMPVPTIRRNMMLVNTVDKVPTMQTMDKTTMQPTVTIPPETTMQVPISNMIQQWNQRQQQQPNKISQQQHYQQQSQRHQQQQQQQQHHHHHHHHHNHQQRLRLLQPEQSPRSQLVAQQQKAEHNRARAQQLWGQPVLQEQENPRPPLKSSYAESGRCDVIDPLELELDISSPSLLCTSSLDSDSDRTAVGDAEFDSISDMSVSPTPTAIRCIPIVRESVKQGDETKSQKWFNTL